MCPTCLQPRGCKATTSLGRTWSCRSSGSLPQRTMFRPCTSASELNHVHECFNKKKERAEQARKGKRANNAFLFFCGFISFTRGLTLRCILHVDRRYVEAWHSRDVSDVVAVVRVAVPCRYAAANFSAHQHTNAARKEAARKELGTTERLYA